ncbi:hypothetical protein PUNSTDRAFT_71894 [Punctularia strigosozonata HHB-11173 SS5]|uniref:uncharacterized protein n=1 Tax=Punctularia strigosozonata (strain HHB-11173) TaxID=741275 RepID=UPI0004418478|nr:uncharacterized protein PUNSTDRAFT_71894 [Punctularia strigosozonata HHB-11173 SS5]EIN06822.1 hypothetical protein PUNSTDRAFT_71894 [Punctularia strigosozonata HHB-11173 SS5]
MATSSRGTENKWTPDEDEILRAAVEKSRSDNFAVDGKKNSWQKISSCLPGRTNKSCRKRWVHSLDPTLRKGRWTAAEDAQLLEAVRVHGKYWWQVARHIEGRTDDQCAKRWREKLDPSISRHAWTKQEDEILLAACETHGKKWNVISKMLPGRPAVHCRNRYQSLQRSLAASSSTATLRPPSVVSSDSSYSESFSSRSPEMVSFLARCLLSRPRSDFRFP